MKRYEIRTADEVEVLSSWRISPDEYDNHKVVLEWWSQTMTISLSRTHLPSSKKWTTSVLGIAEWETEAEADKARLDWLENHRDLWAHHLQCGPGMLRDAIDSARVKPKPTFTVIERSK